MNAPLGDAAEVLFRQIHPNALLNGEPGSDRFRPTEADMHRLSVDRSSLTTAECAHRLYVSRGRRSAAVYGVSVGEFAEQNVPAYADPLTDATGEVANPAHAVADFASHSGRQQKLIAKRLKQLAVRRGTLYAPPQGAEVTVIPASATTPPAAGSPMWRGPRGR